MIYDGSKKHDEIYGLAEAHCLSRFYAAGKLQRPHDGISEQSFRVIKHGET